MHVTGDLNLSSLVVPVVVSLLALVGFGVIRRKWRLAVARKQEIRRLLILASEETSRAELEATLAVPYSAVTVSKKTYQCAVCHSPTTTRCARCKAVRYCSGMCQIIHWRKGHKEECHPPNTAYHSNNNESGIARKIAKHKQYEHFEDRFEHPLIETSSKETMLSNFSLYPVAPPFKDDIDKVESDADTSEYSSSLFSGFSAPATGGESSDNVSVGESIYSSDSDGSDRHIPADIALDMHMFKLSGVALTKPSSPRFASLVNSVDDVYELKLEDQTEPCMSIKDNQCRSSRSPDHSNNLPKPGKISEFWGRTLNSNVSSGNIESDPALSNSGGAIDRKLSNSESFQHFKFNLSGSGSAPSNYCSTEVSDPVLDDTPPSSVFISNSVDGLGLLKKSSLDAPKIWSSGVMMFEKSNYDNFNDFNVPKFSELKGKRSNTLNQKSQTADTGGDMLSRSSSKACPMSSSIERSNIVCHDSVTTAHVAEFKSSSSASQTCLASSVDAHSVSVMKSGKAEIVGAGSVKSHQITSFPPNSVNGLKSSMLKVVDQIRGPKCGKYGEKGLFPYDFFVKLYTSNKGVMLPCGLTNCGNSCYANSVLQCLVFTPPLTAYFAQGIHSKACVHKEWCFTCEFENLILKAKEGKSPLSPSGVISQLQNVGSHLGHGREEDAHEFLRYAIDAMQSVCLKEAGVSALGSFEEETTLIGLTFGGYLHSKIRCMKCHYKSERQERMMDLTVEIEGDVARLEDALRRFTATEILDGDNKYECSRCKSYEKAKKKLTILEAPNVLTIALKRFQSGKFGKLNKSIRFPEVLDLAPYMSRTSDKAPIYRLYGVVVHLDIMNASFSGHYVCYVKNIQNKWFKIDDSTVTSVELERVLTKGAYMLLYARCSPRAPRLMRNRIASIDTKNKDNTYEFDPKNRSLRSAPTRPNIVPLHSNSNSHDTASAESFFLKFHHLQKILEEDSSSDDYSFTSSNSEEGSCSTDSTRNSTSTDDLSDFIFGGWGSSWRNTSDSDSSSSPSSSPLYHRHQTLASLDPNPSRSHDSISSQIDHADSATKDTNLCSKMRNGRSKSVKLDGKGGDHFLQYDTWKQCRKLVGSHSSSRGR